MLIKNLGKIIESKFEMGKKNMRIILIGMEKINRERVQTNYYFC
jgi:hypothetical protein